MGKYVIRPINKSESVIAGEIEKLTLSVPWSAKEICSFLDETYGVYLAAFDGNNMIGICGSYMGAGECDITNIAVLPDYRRQGIAQMLLESLLSEARNRACTSATLEVAEKNIPAQNLYKKNGFITVGNRKKYYPDGDNALLMKLEEI